MQKPFLSSRAKPKYIYDISWEQTATNCGKLTFSLFTDNITIITYQYVFCLCSYTVMLGKLEVSLHKVPWHCRLCPTPTEELTDLLVMYYNYSHPFRPWLGFTKLLNILTPTLQVPILPSSKPYGLGENARNGKCKESFTCVGKGKWDARSRKCKEWKE